jgi:hypothetical protein
MMLRVLRVSDSFRRAYPCAAVGVLGMQGVVKWPQVREPPVTGCGLMAPS